MLQKSCINHVSCMLEWSPLRNPPRSRENTPASSPWHLNTGKMIPNDQNISKCIFHHFNESHLSDLIFTNLDLGSFWTISAVGYFEGRCYHLDNLDSSNKHWVLPRRYWRIPNSNATKFEEAPSLVQGDGFPAKRITYCACLDAFRHPQRKGNALLWFHLRLLRCFFSCKWMNKHQIQRQGTASSTHLPWQRQRYSFLAKCPANCALNHPGSGQCFKALGRIYEYLPF